MLSILGCLAGSIADALPCVARRWSTSLQGSDARFQKRRVTQGLAPCRTVESRLPERPARWVELKIVYKD
jgi:hypothetical protein